MRKRTSVLKYVLLALLARSEAHGYELRSAFENLLGGTWPLNIGQVYTALARLEADGLVSCEVVAQDLLPDRKVYSLTESGRQELKRWTEEPADGPVRLRDELFLKVMARSLLRRGDPLSLVWRQRQSHMQSLAELTAMRRTLSWRLTGPLRRVRTAPELIEGATSATADEVARDTLPTKPAVSIETPPRRCSTDCGANPVVPSSR